MSDLPVGVGGRAGIDFIAFLANCSALSEVFQSVSTLVTVPFGAISMLNLTCPWSGDPAPKIKKINDYGQTLVVDDEKNIHAKYFFSADKRQNKGLLIPVAAQVENLTIAKWERISIQGKLERKFNQKGWFKCLQDSQGFYTEIVFGEPIKYEIWIKLVEDGDVFFDSGMYEGNARPYSQWRASNTFWNKLITSRY
jgi:hypothetical protein